MKIDARLFLAFVVNYFTDEIKLGLCELHREFARSAEMLNECSVAIAAPRGYAKSTYFSRYLPLYCLLEHPGTEILSISATFGFAESWIVKIKTDLESNVGIIQDYGLQGLGVKGSNLVWRNDELHLANKSKIIAKGSGQQLRGCHPHLVIGDDLETDDMVLNEQRMREFDDWWWGTVMQTVKVKNGNAMVIGTMLHPDSFLNKLVRNGRNGWVTRLYQCTKDGRLNDDSESMWPKMYPITKLRAIRDEMGVNLFNQEYLNDPIPDEMRVFKKEWFNYFSEIPRGLEYYMTVDPAISLGTKADYTAMVVCGCDKDGNYYLVDLVNKRMSPSETIDMMFSMYDKWKIHKIGIEDIGFQKMLKNEFEYQRRTRRMYPIVVPLKSEGRRKELRIESLQPRYEAGRIFHRQGLKLTEDLEAQFLRFPSLRGHDDLIDCVAYLPQIAKPGKVIKEKLPENCFDAIMEKRYKRLDMNSNNVWGNHKIMR